MIAQAEKSESHYARFMDLLRQLHQLIAEGDGDSSMADTVRDEMDRHVPHLTELELQRVEGLSGDLYSLTGDEMYTPEDKLNPVSKAELQTASEMGDYDKVLKLLHRPAPFLAPHQIAFLRGFSWAELGDLETAWLFLRHAVQLSPADHRYAAMLMLTLFRLGNLNEAQKYAARLASDPEVSMPDVLLPVAGVMLAGAADLSTAERKAVMERVEQLIIRAFDLDRQMDPNSQLPSSQVSRYYVVLAMCYAALGRHGDEVDAYSKALRHDPGNEDARNEQRLARLSRTPGTNGGVSAQFETRLELLRDTLAVDCRGPGNRYIATCI